MDEFARDWTYRTPMTTISYPAGHRDKLPEHIRTAAQAAWVLVEDAPISNSDGPKAVIHLDKPGKGKVKRTGKLSAE